MNVFFRANKIEATNRRRKRTKRRKWMNEKWRFLILLSEFNNRMKIRRTAKLELVRSNSDQRNLFNFSHLNCVRLVDVISKSNGKRVRRRESEKSQFKLHSDKSGEGEHNQVQQSFLRFEFFFCSVRFHFSRCVKNKLKMLKDKKKWLKVFAFFFSRSLSSSNWLDVFCFFCMFFDLFGLWFEVSTEMVCYW